MKFKFVGLPLTVHSGQRKNKFYGRKFHKKVIETKWVFER